MLLIASLVMAGCVPSPPAPEPTESPEIVIGLLLCMTEETPFFISLVEGAEEAAERLNVKLVVQYAHDDVELQCTQIQTLLDEGVSALLVNPVSDAVAPDIEAAAAAGVPVFTVDRSAPNDAIVCHIASDNLAGGRMAGEYLAEALDREGKVVELEGTPGSSAAHDRGAGFNQAIAAYPNIEVIARETANFNKPDGKAVFARILAERPEIDGVFAHNDDMILGAIEAAQEAGRAEGIAFVGFDAISEAIAALERGDLLATVAQRPAEMGRIGVETAVKYLNGETIPESIPVDLALIIK
jgi:ribose transport system substrate-binding protein